MATAAGVDPWGECWLRDLITGANARMDMEFRSNAQLTAMIANMFSKDPRPLEEFRSNNHG